MLKCRGFFGNRRLNVTHRETFASVSWLPFKRTAAEECGKEHKSVCIPKSLRVTPPPRKKAAYPQKLFYPKFMRLYLQNCAILPTKLCYSTQKHAILHQKNQLGVIWTAEFGGTLTFLLGGGGWRIRTLWWLNRQFFSLYRLGTPCSLSI